MNLKTIVNEFKSQVAFVLILIWFLAIWHFQTFNSIFYPFFAISLMTILDVAYTKIRFKKLYWPSASFVTGVLIGMIIDPSTPLWILVFAVIAAFLSKQFIGVGIRQNIFNPAAFGVMAVYFAFGIPAAWWAVAWSRLPLLILIPAMVWVLFRMKRLWIPLTFLGVYLIYNLTIFTPDNALRSLIDGSVFLFALVMLAEPITSPTVGNFKYFLGPVAAVASIIFSKVAFLGDSFLPSLLIVNFGAFLIRKVGTSYSPTDQK